MGLFSNNKRAEVELKSGFVFIQSPSSTGVEQLASRRQRKLCDPSHPNVHVGSACLDAKWLKRRIQSYITTATADNPHRYSAYAHLAAMRSATVFTRFGHNIRDRLSS